TDNVAELRLQRELTAMSAMYAEVLKNTEVADFSLRNKTPFIQVIDAPILPLAPALLSLPRLLLIGLVLGGFIGVAIIVARKFFRHLLA
ncbi:MAG: GNVR domain-containing protein, partial [Saprospiraceae bacterium]